MRLNLAFLGLPGRLFFLEGKEWSIYLTLRQSSCKTALEKQVGLNESIFASSACWKTSLQIRDQEALTGPWLLKQ